MVCLLQRIYHSLHEVLVLDGAYQPLLVFIAIQVYEHTELPGRFEVVSADFRTFEFEAFLHFLLIVQVLLGNLDLYFDEVLFAKVVDCIVHQILVFYLKHRVVILKESFTEFLA